MPLLRKHALRSCTRYLAVRSAYRELLDGCGLAGSCKTPPCLPAQLQGLRIRCNIFLLRQTCTGHEHTPFLPGASKRIKTTR